MKGVSKVKIKMTMSKIESVVTAALHQRADAMDEAAAEAEKGAKAPPKPDAGKGDYVSRDGVVTVDISPTPEGYAEMARRFTAEAKDARELLEAIEECGSLAMLVYKVAGPRPT